MSAKKGSVKPDGILKSTSSNGTKRTKRVNFNNENDVLEISRTDEEDTSVMESTKQQQTPYAYRASVASARVKQRKEARQIEQNSWKNGSAKASGTQ